MHMHHISLAHLGPNRARKREEEVEEKEKEGE